MATIEPHGYGYYRVSWPWLLSSLIAIIDVDDDIDDRPLLIFAMVHHYY